MKARKFSSDGKIKIHGELEKQNTNVQEKNVKVKIGSLKRLIKLINTWQQ